MIWIAWRFQRSVVLVLALLVLVVIGVALFTGAAQHRDLVELMSAPCRGRQIATPGRGDYCGELFVKISNVAAFNPYIRYAGLIIPPLVGAAFGALALASELDGRTVRLAWTQSISRTRWFAVKVSVGVAFVIIILTPLAFVTSWWSGTIGDRDLFARATYGIAGWDMVAYGLFLFALTLFVGSVIRRVGWTLAAAVLVYLVIVASFPTMVRQHLVAPTVHWSPPSDKTQGNSLVYGESVSPAIIPVNAWVFFSGVALRSTIGVPTYAQMYAISPKVYGCINSYPHKTQSDINNATTTCYKKFKVDNVVVYIADDQFWTIQLREGILYLSAGLVLAAGALVLVRRIEP